MRRAAVSLLAVLSGCDYFFHITQVEYDGGSPDALIVDGPPSSTCELSASLVLLPGFVSATDPAQRADQRELAYSTNLGSDNFHIYTATRTSSATDYSGFKPIDAINSAASDFDPSFTNDGLSLFFLSNRDGSHRVYESARATVDDELSLPTLVDLGGVLPSGTGVDISADGLVLYVVDNSGALQQLARQSTMSPFMAAQTVATDVRWPSVAGDGRTLYYSDASAAMIYRQTRKAGTGLFDAPTALFPGSDPDISDDGRTIVYVLNGTLWSRTCD